MFLIPLWYQISQLYLNDMVTTLWSHVPGTGIVSYASDIPEKQYSWCWGSCSLCPLPIIPDPRPGLSYQDVFLKGTLILLMIEILRDLVFQNHGNYGIIVYIMGSCRINSTSLFGPSANSQLRWKLVRVILSTRGEARKPKTRRWTQYFEPLSKLLMRGLYRDPIGSFLKDH